jgi:aldehyde:ferredoxin oxidoreductase
MLYCLLTYVQDHSKGRHDVYQWEDLEEAIQLVTGQRFAKPELHAMAADIVTITGQFNINEGWQPEDDLLPKRWHDEPLLSGHAITADEMDYMLKDYYRLRGWNSQGFPEG